MLMILLVASLLVVAVAGCEGGDGESSEDEGDVDGEDVVTTGNLPQTDEPDSSYLPDGGD